MIALILGVVFLLVGVGCTQDPNVKKQAAVERAEQYLKEGKTNEAIIELRNALQVDKDFVPALHALGRAYAAKAWYGDAVRELSRAEGLAPSSVPIAVDLGNAFVRVGAWREADERAGRVLEREPAHPDATVIRASVLLGRGNAKEALEAIKQLSSTPAWGSPAVQSVRARALFRLGDRDEAEKAYRAVLAVNSKDIEALLGMGEIVLARGEPEKAAQFFSDAKAAHPSDPRARLGLAITKAQRHQLPGAIRELEELDRRARTLAVITVLGRLYIEADRSGEAVQLLSPLLTRAPKLHQVRFLLGRAYLANNRPDDAIREFEILRRELPDDPSVQFRLAQAYGRRGRLKDALANLDAVAKPFDKTAEYHLERGRVLLMLDRSDDALRSATVAQKLVPQAPQPYLLLGEIRRQQGNAAAARDMFAKAAEVDASFAAAHVALGRLQLAEKNVEGAMKEFDLAVEARPSSLQAISTKVIALVQAKRIKEAIEFLEASTRTNPRTPDLQVMLGGLYLTDRQPAKAATAYKKALELDGQLVAPRLGLARIAMQDGKDDEAVAQLQAAVKQHPDHATAVVLLAALSEKLGRYEQAIGPLEAALKNRPQQSLFLMALGPLYLRTGRYDDAIKAMGEVLAMTPGSVGAQLVRGEAYLAKRDVVAAVKQATELAKAHPTSAPAQFLLGRSYAAVGRIPDAVAALQEAVRLEPNFPAAKVALAALTSGKEGGAPGEQVEVLREASKKDPRNVAVRESLVRALVLRNDLKAAQAEAKQLLDLAPTHPGGNLLMAQILARQNLRDDAANYLRAALKGNPSLIEANVALAEYLESKGQLEQAIPLLEQAHRTNPDITAVKLHLAALYADSRRFPDALRLVQEVEKTEPKNAAAPVIRGMVLLGQQNAPAAAAAFEAALALKPDVPEAYRGLGQAREAMGKPDQAIESYRKALALRGTDLVALNNLAWLLAEVKKQPNDALPMAVKAAQLAPQQAAVLDTLGWVHYLRGDYAEAEKVLLRAVERAPNHGTMRYHLGMAYYRLGKKTDAVSTLRRATQLDPKLTQGEKIDSLIKELGG